MTFKNICVSFRCEFPVRAFTKFVFMVLVEAESIKQCDVCDVLTVELPEEICQNVFIAKAVMDWLCAEPRIEVHSWLRPKNYLLLGGCTKRQTESAPEGGKNEKHR